MGYDKILKHPLRETGVTVVDCGKVLHVGVDHQRKVCVWAWGNNPTTKHFEVFATGEPILPETPGRFVGTAITPAGFVWHVFENLVP
jgi:hypothetical protein